MIALDILVTLLALVALAHAAWWLLLSVIALPAAGQEARGDATPLRVAVLIPAHNEEALLPATLAALRPGLANRADVLVVADNCIDATAEVARRTGVAVLERYDPVLRGKSYALDAGLRQLASRPTPPDVVVFVDADCVVSPGFLEQLVAAFARPAVHAVQAYYEPAPATSDLGRLRRVAFALLHYARPLGAKRLGLPTTIKGTGMALRWELVRDGFGAAGLAEDAALTLALARQGVCVGFVPLARLSGHMAQDYASARTQDHRWERGRLGLAREAVAIALRLVGRGRVGAAAAALEVASLPLSLLVLLASTALAAGMAGVGRLDVALASCLALVGYVLLGALAARVSCAEVLSLFTAPRFLLYKCGVYLRSAVRGQLDWTRTRR